MPPKQSRANPNDAGLSLVITFTNYARGARVQEEGAEEQVVVDFTKEQHEPVETEMEEPNEPSKKRGTFARRSTSASTRRKHKEIDQEALDAKILERKRREVERLMGDAEIIYQKLLAQDNEDSNEDEDIVDQESIAVDSGSPATINNFSGNVNNGRSWNTPSSTIFTYTSKLIPVSDIKSEEIKKEEGEENEHQKRREIKNVECSSLTFNGPGSLPLPVRYIEYDSAAPFYDGVYF